MSNARKSKNWKEATHNHMPSERLQAFRTWQYLIKQARLAFSAARLARIEGLDAKLIDGLLSEGRSVRALAHSYAQVWQ